MALTAAGGDTARMFDDGHSDFGFLLQPSHEEGETDHATGSADASAGSILVPLGSVIESNGSTVLTRVGDNYFLHPVGDSNGVELSAFGAPVVAGQFGTFAPIAAESTTGGGYAVAWKAAGADQYTVLNADGSGVFQSHAFFVVSGGSYALQSIEPAFQQDLNSDGVVGPTPLTIEGMGTAHLVQQGDSYFLYDGSGAAGPQLKSHGTAVTVGSSGGWTPVGAEAVSGGYEVVWQYGSQFTLWTGIDGNGDFTGDGISVGSQTYSLLARESTFGQDLNQDGQVGPTQVSIDAVGTAHLVQLGDGYFLYDGSGAAGPQLKSHGTAVTAGSSGGWTPVGAEAVLGGYEVVWQYGNKFTLWTGIDGTGNFAGEGVSASSQSYALLSRETTFGQDLNQDGQVGPTQVSIDALGTAHLVQLGDGYFLYDGSGAAGPQLKSHGTAVTAGSSSGWTPVGVEAVPGGYEVVWQFGNQFTLWSGIDGTADFAGTGVSAGSQSYALLSRESTFGQDFNHDGQVGPTQITIEGVGTARLVQLGDGYFLYDGSGAAGPQLRSHGAAVTVGSSSGWTPVGAEAVSGGYQVVWQYGNQFTLWTGIDATGNFAGSGISAGGSNYLLQAAESTFGQDFNHDGQVGPVQVTIDGGGTAHLVQLGDGYFLYDGSGAAGPQLKSHGTAVTAGSSGGWTPVGAEAMSGGYEVVWQYGNQFTLWTGIDGTGNFAGDGVSAGSRSYLLQAAESTFGQDFNQDGTIGGGPTVIEAAGATSLVRLGDNYYLLQTGSQSGPQLSYGGGAVTAGMFGAWTPIAAEATSSGYDVTWKANGADQYQVWTTDAGGNYFSSLFGIVSGSSWALRSLEGLFQQDLNSDGAGVPASAYDIAISFSGNQAYLPYFTAAALRWQTVITGDLPAVNNPGYGFIDDLLISATVSAIDGVGGILGSAGPDYIRSSGTMLPTHGNMTFDSADLDSMASNGTLYYVVLHEMGHVLGIGSMWSYFGLVSGSQYLGQNALAAYRQLSGDASAPSVPLETTGGSGTARVHWSEATFGNELMTGYISGTPDPLSTLDIGTLKDMGYTVNPAAADPYTMPGHLMADAGGDLSGSTGGSTIIESSIVDRAFSDEEIGRA